MSEVTVCHMADMLSKSKLNIFKSQNVSFLHLQIAEYSIFTLLYTLLQTSTFQKIASFIAGCAHIARSAMERSDGLPIFVERSDGLPGFRAATGKIWSAATGFRASDRKIWSAATGFRVALILRAALWSAATGFQSLRSEARKPVAALHILGFRAATGFRASAQRRALILRSAATGFRSLRSEARKPVAALHIFASGRADNQDAAAHGRSEPSARLEFANKVRCVCAPWVCVLIRACGSKGL